MNAQEAKNIILTVFKTKWDAIKAAASAPLVYADPVYNDVPGVTPAGEQVWARATVRHHQGRQRSLSSDVGTRRFVSGGLLWVQVFAPIGDGSTAALAASQAIVDAYRDAKTSVLFRNVRLEEMGCEGAFERVDVKTEFEYDEVR